jgi:hypothetical protein
MIPLGLAAEGAVEVSARALAAIDEDDSCLTCHQAVTPGIVQSWRLSKHAFAVVSCETCHNGLDGDPSVTQHYGYSVTAVPSPNYCGQCHAAEVKQNGRSKHAWTAFIGNFKPYYQKARSLGLDPLSQETAKRLDPDSLAKKTVSPLFPDSGILKMTGLLDNPSYHHNNVNLGCAQCHGTFVIAEEDGSLTGWPNTGIGRINPDGSLGSCSSCHTRHLFSVEEARKPYTCGQCHLGPDHPQIEIFEESKHGNIYDANGEQWSWHDPAGEWGPEDIDAPTCAACHMSGFGGQLETTHDVGERLYWELQPKRSVPQWKNADQVDDLVLQRVSDPQLAEAGRSKMKNVCNQCHSPNWVNGYFDEFDKVVGDYNLLWDYTDQLLTDAYAKGLASKDNPIDEIPEIYHYLIWHHSGRRWRMGAAMMGPDWTHWNGAVDTIMITLGSMVSDLQMREKLREIEKK